MPSPFPGMDPYLEEPNGWPDVHHELITEIKTVLNRLLRPRYFVKVEERVYISDESDPGRKVIAPDLRVIPGHDKRRSKESRGAVVVAEPVVLTTLIEEEIHEAYLEVIDAKGRGVVAVIEVVSPTNKVSGSVGRAMYLRKRQEVMHSPSHWMEIDLLRSGEPLVAQEALPGGDYFVHVSKVEARPKGFVWPILLEQRLPVVPVPLKGGDPDAHLDLQQVLDAIYDRSPYDLDIDYRADPVPPLPVEKAEWVRRLLAEKRLR